MKHNQRTPVGKRRKSPSLLERIQPAAAGIDCGEKSHFVAVPPERDPQPVREFRTFTTKTVSPGRLAFAVRDQDGRDGIDRGLLDSTV